MKKGISAVMIIIILGILFGLILGGIYYFYWRSQVGVIEKGEEAKENIKQIQEQAKERLKNIEQEKEEYQKKLNY